MYLKKTQFSVFRILVYLYIDVYNLFIYFFQLWPTLRRTGPNHSVVSPAAQPGGGSAQSAAVCYCGWVNATKY